MAPYKNYTVRDRHLPYFSCLMLTGVLIIAPITSARAEAVPPFIHPGLLHTRKDFERMHTKVTQGAQPYIDGWQKLRGNKHASLDWHPNPQAVIYRGNFDRGVTRQNG
ncbi:twin-arginine translocation pathway signal [Rahnella aquatilis CIP 78.65 = ATCC 33071]|uniref:Uncharacterized protein n=1 Tax=Rahnella aquatilis (strain ATCC 33071 / DSM 4594 / JCM 1683 / NBRC 105701 / NCIMB 13365 / CIP 78.65) TaxID=745277 RepID=H2J2L0_RAHAC|nr:hypothetical protein [Rahnella aquatilis]AEX54721.1 hypothetical protein Rahaq2_5012 [Rahnella aquatilis CIP 78.65 = ATCC 33071]KFC99527.1 twin-arginine translocation pathway signal [Rahnella aquatilis CIP 78.65 = ATCC 33071]